MEKQRRHKKIRLDTKTLDGKMLLTDNAEILNLSSGGASLQSDKGLIVGNRYLITCAGKGKGIRVTGIAVHSEFAGPGEKSGTESAARYTAHIRFDAGQDERVAYLIDSVERDREMDSSVETERRRHVRFRMTMPLESILSHTGRFNVKTMSMTGMLIQSLQPLEINSTVPMELSLTTGSRVSFIGRVASCIMTNDNSRECYDIGVEFQDLTETGRSMLRAFLSSLAAAKDTTAGETA
jgi:hypothetical protein